jgi:acetyl esterase/lipase
MAGSYQRAPRLDLRQASGVSAYGPDPVVVPGTARVVGEYGEWWVPPRSGEEALTTVVLVHGGFWKPGYDRSLEDAGAADLAGRGYLVWNIDYRSGAEPWPATTDDVTTAYAELGAAPVTVDAARVAAVGHSAGGHLALWLGATARPRPALVVAQAPVADLVRGWEQGLGGGAVAALLSGGPEEVPERYAAADPIQLLPTGVRTVLVHGRDDDTVPIEQSERYLAAATTAGDACTLKAYDGGHYEHLDPGSEAVALLREALEEM